MWVLKWLVRHKVCSAHSNINCAPITAGRCSKRWGRNEWIAIRKKKKTDCPHAACFLVMGRLWSNRDALSICVSQKSIEDLWEGWLTFLIEIQVIMIVPSILQVSFKNVLWIQYPCICFILFLAIHTLNIYENFSCDNELNRHLFSKDASCVECRRVWWACRRLPYRPYYILVAHLSEL